MAATVITIGDEILSGHTLDTNFHEIATQLLAWGYVVGHHETVPDRMESIQRALEAALGAFDPILLTGGLGGTPDDLTLDAVAAALGLRLSPDPGLLDGILKRYRRTATPTLRRIARRIEGSRHLLNPVGQAPGVWITTSGGARIVLLPGVPQEARGILRESLFETMGPGPLGSRKILRTVGRGEGDLAEELAAAGFHGLSFLPSAGRVDLVLPSGVTPEREDALRRLLGESVFTEGADSLARCVCEALWRRGATLALAESLTGGALGAAITQVPGASRAFLGSEVLYADDLKRDWLGVPADLLGREGAVSAPVAREMARLVREKAGASFALSTTGIAGPSGATPVKPVGLVYIGLAGAEGLAHVVRHEFRGGRLGVIDRTVTASLDLLRRGVLGLSLPPEVP